MNNKLIRKKLRDLGWKWHRFYISKDLGKGIEIDIEFCIGDFCLGIYKDKQLLEEKQRCKNFMEALVNSIILESKYKL